MVAGVDRYVGELRLLHRGGKESESHQKHACIATPASKHSSAMILASLAYTFIYFSLARSCEDLLE
jgi:hypothetical protein